ncbi:MAG: UMP kinase [Spirochaetales bacterium]|jgi:uridylate kinase|nr:UMP kinase [Spirochaetales bacterium]
MKDTKVISLGGSLIAPQGVDIPFLQDFQTLIRNYLDQDPERRLIFVTGGGGPARSYQEAYRRLVSAPEEDQQDWIGIAATRLNGRLIQGIFSDYAPDPLVIDPSGEVPFTGRVLVAAGWKPGFSSDFDAVLLAQKFSAPQVINLSNIPRVYSGDPKKDPLAVPYDKMTFAQLQKLVGERWIPGNNVPFDPVATKKAGELGLTLIIAAGGDMKNLACLLTGGPFTGTLIQP